MNIPRQKKLTNVVEFANSIMPTDARAVSAWHGNGFSIANPLWAESTDCRSIPLTNG